MENRERVPIVVWILLAVLLAPFAFFFVMPFVLMTILRSPILSGLSSGAVGSALILGVVRLANRRDSLRPDTVYEDKSDDKKLVDGRDVVD